MEGPQLQGCKLPRNLENPLDDLLMVLVEPLLQPLRDAGATPNIITALSALSAAASIHFCFRGRPLNASLLWVLGYVLDIMDGFMARRFSMETRFGCLFDHITDTAAFAGLLAFIASSLMHSPHKVFWPLAVELLLICGSVYHMHCQEKGSPHLAISGISGCACADKRHLAHSRWVGTGTLMAWHVFLIWFYSTP